MQPKTASAVHTHTPPKAPPVYRPQANPVGVQAKMSGAAQMKNRPAAPPVYRPQPVPKVLQRSSRNAQTAATQPPPKPAARFAGSGPAGTVQRYVDPSKADITSSGKYLVKRDDLTVLYSTRRAAPPQPYGLYARGEDYTVGRYGKKIPLNSWTPNVRFIDKAEAKAEPVLDQPGTFSYKTQDYFFNSKTYNIRDLQTGVWDPQPGLDGAPTVGALGKNDCNIWASALQNLIADEKGAVYEMERGRQGPRTVRVQSPTTTPADLKMKVGDLMKHIYEGTGSCRYHAATVVAKDGNSLVTLEGHVDKSLSRPIFQIRAGLDGFAAEGIADKEGDKVEIVPVTSLTYEEVQAEKETREKRFRRFGKIDSDDWRDFESQHHTYRNTLVGDIGITPTREKQRRDELARKLKPQFDEIYESDRKRHEGGLPPVYTSFPRIK